MNWKKFRDNIFRTFRGNLYEKKDGQWEASIGRWMCWGCFAMMSAMWLSGSEYAPPAIAKELSFLESLMSGHEVPSTLFAAWLATLTYNGGKHGKDFLASLLALRGR